MGRRARGYAGDVSEANGGAGAGAGHRPRSPLRRLRVRRHARRVEQLRTEIEHSDDSDPIACLELLYRLADETEKLDRLTPGAGAI